MSDQPAAEDDPFVDPNLPRDAFRKNPIFFADDYIKVSVKGLNIYMTMDYSVIGKDGFLGDSGLCLKGSAMVRAIDSVMELDLLAQHSPSGVMQLVALNPETSAKYLPHRKDVEKPFLRFGKLETRFDGLVIDGLPNIIARIATHQLEKEIGAVISDQLTLQLANVSSAVVEISDKIISQSVNTFLESMDVPIPTFPRLAITEPRWEMKKRHLVVTANLLALEVQTREVLAKEVDLSMQKKAMLSTTEDRPDMSKEVLETLPVNQAFFRYAYKHDNRLFRSDTVREILARHIKDDTLPGLNRSSSVDSQRSRLK
jgi:hypothetical protein